MTKEKNCQRIFVKNFFTKRIFIFAFVLLFFSCRSIHTVFYDFKNEQLQSEIRILQISDFHSNDFGKNEATIIQKISDVAPHVILITGDLFDNKMGNAKWFSNVEKLLAGIYELAPIYFVSGNHDFIALEMQKKYELLEKYKVHVLHDEVVVFHFENGEIVFAGIDDPYFDLGEKIKKEMRDDKAKYRSRLQVLAEKTKQRIAELSKNAKRIFFSMLLVHRPEYVKDYELYDFDFIVAGHAHGGQWRFPPLNNGIYAPGQGMFPKYAGGRYDLKNGSVMIVSRGLSWQRPRLARICNNPELVVVRIRNEQ